MEISRRVVALVTAVVTTSALLAATPATPAHGLERDQARSVSPCSDLRGQTGLTRSTLTIGNVADITGPVPGLREAEQQAVRAFVEYANAQKLRVCGRRLAVATYDSRTDAAGDRSAYAEACGRVFAAVGSASVFDAGGAATAQMCGLPDLRVESQSDARRRCRTCVAVRPSNPRFFPAAVPDFLRARFPAAAARTAFFYVGDELSARARSEARVWTRRGVGVRRVQKIETAEFNYAVHVTQLKNDRIRVVRFVGRPALASRMAAAMRDQDYTPAAFVPDTAAYSESGFPGRDTRAVNTLVPIDFRPLEEAAAKGELRLYRTWLQRTSPGSEPTVGGLYAWSASRLFLRTARSLEGDLTRATLVAALRRTKSWNARGLHAPQPIAAATVSGCRRFLRPTRDGAGWEPAFGGRFRCGPVLSSS